MKKVFLYAYDRQNLGDDLFIHTITKRYPHVKFYMWSDKKNRETFRCLPNLKVIDGASKCVRLLHRLRPSFVLRYQAWWRKRCQAVVYIAGSIFMEYDPWEPSWNWWTYLVENYPMFVMGSNFGPYYTKIFCKKMGEVFAKMQDMCFRDKYSYQLFSDVKTVRYAPDILFSYPMPQVPVKEKQIFVSVIDCTGRDENHSLPHCDECYVNNMAQLLGKYLSAGYRVVFGSFCRHEGDEKGIEKILKVMGCQNHENVSVLAYNGTNAQAMTEAIAQSEFVIATRFHATILALVAGRPVLPVVYSDKTLHVLKDLGFGGMILDIRKNEPWMCNFDCTSLHIGDEFRAAALEHFAKLDQLLLNDC